MLTQGKVQIPAVIVVTVDIGDDGGVGVISSSSSSSGHGHGYHYGEKWGGVDQRGVVGIKKLREMGDEAEWDGEWAAAVDEWAPTIGGEWLTPTRDGRGTALTANG